MTDSTMDSTGSLPRAQRDSGWFIPAGFGEQYARIIGPAALGVYYALFQHKNADWRCRPSFQRIAAVSGYSRRTAIRAVSRLRAHGLISWATVHEPGQLPYNVYTINRAPMGGKRPAFNPRVPVALDPAWQPSPAQIAWAGNLGISEVEIERTTRRFVATYAHPDCPDRLTADDWAAEWAARIQYPDQEA